jgi:hypothetical protein
MKALRFTITASIVCVMAAAIGAAPSKKSPTSARVAPPISAPQNASGDVARPTTQSTTEIGERVIPEAAPENEFGFPEIEGQELVAPDPAGVSAGNPVNMDWYSINNGGAIEVAAGNIKMGISIGQNAVGEVSAGNIKMGLGFWYGASGSSSTTCACDCAADPECDSLTDIFDVTQIVNVAFRNGAPLLDPNNLCPWVTTDVNCDGLTDIFDVTRMVNVAFRNGDPAVEFCNPCAPNL